MPHPMRMPRRRRPPPSCSSIRATAKVPISSPRTSTSVTRGRRTRQDLIPRSPAARCRRISSARRVRTTTGRWARACRVAVTASSSYAGVRLASAKLARDIIEERHPEQQHQQRDADLLAKYLRALAQGLALDPFCHLKHDLAAIQQRDRQQVEQRERQRDQYQKLQE